MFTGSLSGFFWREYISDSVSLVYISILNLFLILLLGILILLTKKNTSTLRFIIYLDILALNVLPTTYMLLVSLALIKLPK